MSSAVRRAAALSCCLALACGTVVLVGQGPAHAVDTKTAVTANSVAGVTATSVAGVAAAPMAAPAPGFSLSISPTRLVIGQHELDTPQRFQVSNKGNALVSVTVQKRNFTGGPDGSLVFQTDAPYSASAWVAVAPMTFELAPGTTQLVTVDVSVPKQPESGDHQVALVFLVPAGKTAANVRINRGIGAPIYITVPGPVDDSAELTGLSAPAFAIGGPVVLTSNVRDTGTVHRDFRGDTALTVDAAGSAAVFPDFTVMRGASRDISTSWHPPLICLCNVEVTFTNADGAVQTRSVRVIVVPLPLIGMLVAGLLLVLAGFWLLRRRYHAQVLQAATKLQRPSGVGGV